MDDQEKAEKKEADYNRIPDDLMELRACLVCSMIKNRHQFILDGCDNCPFLEMKGSKKKAIACTSLRFTGFVGLTDTKRGWVCRRMQLESFLPGAYAISVEGSLPKDVENKLHQNIIDLNNLNQTS